jgi:poly-gamma-glutamate capsule biosynthesis protein CapA/YwtB (metallophosphatase superfamily)
VASRPRGCICMPFLADRATAVRGDDPTEEIALFLCGDVMTGRGIDQLLPRPCEPTLYEPYIVSANEYVALAERATGPLPRPVNVDYPWGDAITELNDRRPHLRIINLETSVTRSAAPEPKGINYRMSPENFACIEAAAVDCCVLANNHVLDWGEAGLLETLVTIEAAGIAAAGAGRNIDEAAAPAVLPVTGTTRVLVFAFACPESGVPQSWRAVADRPGVDLLPDLSPETARRISARVAAVKAVGDIAIASIHWGGNWGYAISRSQRAFAHQLIDEGGVDLVHGHSSHHPKAIEVHRNRLILYGCGDFINDYEGIAGYESFRDDLVLMYLPMVRSIDGALARLAMTPFRIRNFRLNRAVREDTLWLREMLDRESSRFGARVESDEDGSLHLEWR